MEKETIIFTALPNGRDPVDGALRLSVFVSPRLWTDNPIEGASLPAPATTKPGADRDDLDQRLRMSRIGVGSRRGQFKVRRGSRTDTE